MIPWGWVGLPRIKSRLHYRNAGVVSSAKDTLMNFRLLTHRDVRDLLPMSECVDVMAGALAALSRGEVLLPLRTMMWLPDRSGLLGLMPSYLGEPRCFGLKVISFMPGNMGTEYESHQGAVLLFEADHGQLLAVMDASSITAIRTAAASGLATRLLARVDAGELAILGSGVQAASHLEAMSVVRTLRRVRVWSRDGEGARAFAEREGRRLGQQIEAVPSARTAVRGADIICTTTGAKEPVLAGEWLSPGAHVNAVGACFPTTRELDTQAVLGSRFYVDCRESTLNEAGDFLIPRAEGVLGDDHIVGEIGDVVLGKVEGRRSPDEITVFKSLGIAIEDLASAHHIYRKAIASDRGLRADLGGKR
jgi:ornithine cyclodeaminase/alanine dehydrogenase-like protein (mu-crystallin family)